VDAALELFPELEPLLKRRAGLLSGGEQQMLTLGRALARKPRVLIADELSLGLAPLVVTRLLQAVRDAADTGIGVLLVEQHVRQALRYADRVCVMTRGEIVLEGPPAELASRVDEIETTYFATS
jgi:branched-chain amino acid transport system ATP-binding protein